jgi:hypothetical protein
VNEAFKIRPGTVLKIVSGRFPEHAVAKAVGRINCARIAGREMPGILRERATLLTVSLERGLTRSEERRLEYLRWTLDRFDDAAIGWSLDEMALRVGIDGENGYLVACPADAGT